MFNEAGKRGVKSDRARACERAAAERGKETEN
jgi:hypothetical protein